MAQFRLNAYDADVFLPSFLGLKQDDIGLSPDMRFAEEEENVETPNGVLQPRAASVEMSGQFPARIETLLRFHRRLYTGAGSKDFLVAATDGAFYFRKEGGSEWLPIEMPPGVTSFQSNVWSWVTYEMNFEGSDYPVDVLVVSNAVDGMYMILPSDIGRTWGVVYARTWGQALSSDWLEPRDPFWFILPVDTHGYKFSVIERSDERIWGGGIPGNDDLLVYSAPYNALNWEPNEEIPEDGAGEIRLPSWDGDAFTTLKTFGDQLLAFKKWHVWRILGTNPGEYVVKEQYGGGAPFPNTVISNAETVLIMDKDGMSIYDGISVKPYMRGYIEQLWKTVNKAALDQMCAALYKNRYYLAFPTGDSMVNNTLLIWNMDDGTFLLHTDIYIESLLATDAMLYATSSSLPGKVLELRYNSWDEGAACGEQTRWVSPWLDFTRKDIQKGGFDLYFIPEVQDTAVTLSFSVQTEKKLKTKQYTVQPLTAEQRAAQKEHRGKRLHFGGAGRRFRIIIETADGITAPWRLIGGLHLIVETDPD